MDVLKNWMSKVQDETLNSLVLLGTHDSAGFEMDFDNTPKLQSEPFDVRKFGLIPTLENSVRKWSITQNINLYRQCMNGIRAFDLRCSMPKDGTIDFWLEHSYATIKLKDGLAQLYQFCTENPTEIIILWFRIEVSSNFKFQNQLLELWKPYFDIMFNHKNNYTNQTVGSLLKKSIRWVVYGNVELDSTSPYFGNYQYGIVSPWINTEIPETKIEGLKFQLNQTNNKLERENFYGLSWTLTPQLNQNILPTVLRTIFCCHNCCIYQDGSLKDMATKFNERFESFGKENLKQIKQKVNIIWIDFPQFDQYFYDILLQQINYKS